MLTLKKQQTDNTMNTALQTYTETISPAIAFFASFEGDIPRNLNGVAAANESLHDDPEGNEAAILAEIDAIPTTGEALANHPAGAHGLTIQTAGFSLLDSIHAEVEAAITPEQRKLAAEIQALDDIRLGKAELDSLTAVQ